MRAIVQPRRLSGSLAAIPSKSQAHRLLICAALAGTPTRVLLSESSEDIDRTAACLRAMGSDMVWERGEGFALNGGAWRREPLLNCGESGSTYRFLLPVACALGLDAGFELKGRLPSRPMEALFQALEQKGIRIADRGSSLVQAFGKLSGGAYELPGNLSSQFVSGLMLAAPLTGEDCLIRLSGELESRGYVDMTADAMRRFGIAIDRDERSIVIRGGQRYTAPASLRVEGDWSNAAIWLCAAAAGGQPLTIRGLDPQSLQGDRAIVDMLRRFGARVHMDCETCRLEPAALRGCTIDIRNTPDLAPALALLAVAAEGESRLTGVARLRLKESDRARSICDTITSLGGRARAEGDSLIIEGIGALRGSVCEGQGDHRIVMLAAAASVLSGAPIEINGAEAINKSYPRFFEDLRALGGQADLAEA